MKRIAVAALERLLLVVFVACLFVFVLLSTGCRSTCPPCEPEIRYESVPMIVTRGIEIEPLPTIELPEYPPHPGPDATPDERKEWAIRVAEVARLREAILIARDVAWLHKIETANEWEPPVP